MLLRRYRDRRGSVKTAAEVESAAVPVTEEVNLEEMTAEELKAYAEENGIDIGKATSQEGILKKIQEAAEEQEPENEVTE